MIFIVEGAKRLDLVGPMVQGANGPWGRGANGPGGQWSMGKGANGPGANGLRGQWSKYPTYSIYTTGTERLTVKVLLIMHQSGMPIMHQAGMPSDILYHIKIIKIGAT